MTTGQPSTNDVELEFRSVRGRSFLGGQYVSYPYHITRMLYEDIDEQTVPKLILQSLSGGVYQGEHLSHSFALGPSARVDLRTQGSTIVQNAQGSVASSTTDIRVSTGSSIIYVPEPQIIFNGADFTNTVKVRGVEAAAHVVVADSFLAYDPVVDSAAADFRFTMFNAFFDSQGNELVIDKSIVHGASHQQAMNGYQAYVSFMFHGKDFNEAFLTECCRENEQFAAEAAFSALPQNSGYVIKALAADGAALSQVLDHVRDKSLLVVNSKSSATSEVSPTS